MNSRSRSFQDKLISGVNGLRYRLTEPLYVRVMRRRFEKSYEQDGPEPFISVYVPTYNRAALLMERAVPTVLAQNYSNFEFVIVGDCCTDDTERWVKGIGDPRIRFYNLPSRGYRYPPTAENHWLAGPVVAGNKGLELVRGRWIARIDDDDIWTPDHLAVSLQYAREGNFEFVSAQYLEERHGQKSVNTGVGALDAYFTRRDVRSNQSRNPLIGGPCTWLYRSYLRCIQYNRHCWRKHWNRVNDIDLVLRIFQCGVRMGYLDQVTAHMIPRPGEETVGLEAYLLQALDKEEHYKFSARV